MSNFARVTLVIGAVLLAAATGLGAYASHGLDAHLQPDALASFGIGVDYQFYHSLGLLVVALLIDRFPAASALKLSAILIVLGIVLFSGGVYASSLTGPRWIAHLAPVGGLSLIAAWLVAAYAAIRLTTTNAN